MNKPNGQGTLRTEVDAQLARAPEMWLMSLVTIVAAYSLFASLNLAISTQRQLEGIALIKPICRTMQVIQQRRGISTEFRSGDVAFNRLNLC